MTSIQGVNVKSITERAAEAVTIRQSGGCFVVEVVGIEESNRGALRESAESHAVMVRHQLAVAAGIAVAFIDERADQVAREVVAHVETMAGPASDAPVLCARSACRAPGATWWNTSTRAYYCTPCAHRINEGAPGLCVNGGGPESEAPRCHKCGHGSDLRADDDLVVCFDEEQCAKRRSVATAPKAPTPASPADGSAPQAHTCRSGADGDCYWTGCPQERDGEPGKSGRSCPLLCKDGERRPRYSEASDEYIIPGQARAPLPPRPCCDVARSTDGRLHDELCPAAPAAAETAPELVSAQSGEEIGIAVDELDELAASMDGDSTDTQRAIARIADRLRPLLSRPSITPAPQPDPVHVTISSSHLDELSKQGNETGETHDGRSIVIHLAPSAVDWLKGNGPNPQHTDECAPRPVSGEVADRLDEAMNNIRLIRKAVDWNHAPATNGYVGRIVDCAYVESHCNGVEYALKCARESVVRLAASRERLAREVEEVHHALPFIAAPEGLPDAAAGVRVVVSERDTLRARVTSLEAALAAARDWRREAESKVAAAQREAVGFHGRIRELESALAEHSTDELPTLDQVRSALTAFSRIADGGSVNAITRDQDVFDVRAVLLCLNAALAPPPPAGGEA